MGGWELILRETFKVPDPGIEGRGLCLNEHYCSFLSAKKFAAESVGKVLCLVAALIRNEIMKLQ